MQRNTNYLQNPRENLNPHRCCCKKCHVKTGTIIIGILELIYLIYFLIYSTVVWLKSGSAHLAGFIFYTICGLIGLMIIIVLFQGVLGKMPYCLVPFMIYQVFAIVFRLVMSILSVVALSTGNEEILRIINVSDVDQENLEPGGSSVGPEDRYFASDSENLRGIVIAQLILFFLTFLLEIWFFTVVFRCFKYLKELASDNFRGSNKSQEFYNAYSPPRQQPVFQMSQIQSPRYYQTGDHRNSYDYQGTQC